MIKVILWDIDGTLLNFLKAEKYAIRKCFSNFHLGECTDEMIRRYSAINDKYWKKLERREITKAEVLHNRFEEFFQKENIDFREIDELNKFYQFSLGDKIFFNDDSYELVKELKNTVKQYAVTNGTYVAQERKLKRSGLDEIFNDVFISEQIGIDKPNKEFFDAVWKKIGEYKQDEVMIVGDSLTSDMQGGVNAGIICCWYNPYGVENKSNLKPEFEIQDLQQIKKIIENGENTMTQKERMLRGMLYDPNDREIMDEQFPYLDLLSEFNALPSSAVKERDALMKKMFASCGENCYIQPPFYANWSGHHIHMGNNVYANFNFTVVDDGDVYIGDYVMFGPNVTIATAGHPIEISLRKKALQFNLPVHIGNNVWVGANVTILPGVTIGDNSVIGAGSVITKDIPANVVAVGNPCKVMREISERDRKYYYKDREIDPEAWNL